MKKVILTALVIFICVSGFAKEKIEMVRVINFPKANGKAIYAETIKLLAAKYHLHDQRISYYKYPTLMCNVTMPNSLSESYYVYLYLRFDFKNKKVRAIIQKAEINGAMSGNLNLKSINEKDYKVLRSDIESFFDEYKNSLDLAFNTKW